MSSEAIRNAMRIVQAHGFECVALTDGVLVGIPWVHTVTKATGIDWIHCHTHRAVFIALGY